MTIKSAIIWTSWLFSNYELPDLFAEAWNICSNHCFDIRKSEVLIILDSRTRVDIKHDSQHGSFCLKILQAMNIKKLKISWKSLTNFLVQLTNFEN